MMTIDEAIRHCEEVAEKMNDCECAADHRQLAEWLTELKEAKRLLKAAVEDFKVIGKALDADCDILINCEECPLQSGHYNCRSWNHQDEALALIGKDIDVPASADDTNVGHKSGGWISCEDRLPIEQGPVLCYARSTTGEGNYRILGTLRNGEFWFLQVDGTQLSFPNLCLEVTHWMPLPDPPDGGADNA
ncbi:MAG: DUF551 domain-containing protein [Ruminococcus sp.]|nr:DUF551 domain-containing protein [Ruminococcus sp.]